MHPVLVSPSFARIREALDQIEEINEMTRAATAPMRAVAAAAQAAIQLPAQINIPTFLEEDFNDA